MTGAGGSGPGAGPVVVAVLTFRRPAQLAALLPELLRQCRALARPACVLVVDNDPEGGGAPVVAPLAGADVRYVHEPEPGIAAARNRALDEAGQAGVLVFVDDDEQPSPRWLELLVAEHGRTGAAAVCGPVVTTYAVEPGRWTAGARLFDRPRPPTGTALQAAATNNLLLDLPQVRALGVRFDARYGLSGGSDTLFTRQLAARGGCLVWCDEAEVTDVLPPGRDSLRWVLTRAMRIGLTWSRTSLDLASSPRARGRARAAATGGGLARVAAGMAQVLVGTVAASPRRQARGLKGTARGVGLLVGAYGVVYTEYARPGPRRSRRAAA